MFIKIEQKIKKTENLIFCSACLAGQVVAGAWWLVAGASGHGAALILTELVDALKYFCRMVQKPKLVKTDQTLVSTD